MYYNLPITGTETYPHHILVNHSFSIKSFKIMQLENYISFCPLRNFI